MAVSSSSAASQLGGVVGRGRVSVGTGRSRHVGRGKTLWASRIRMIRRARWKGEVVSVLVFDEAEDARRGWWREAVIT